MTAIGGKTRKAKTPAQPQVVIQFAHGLNQYARIGKDDEQRITLLWVGDPNSATKFNSKYEAKLRTREMADVPETRVFHMLEAAR